MYQDGVNIIKTQFKDKWDDVWIQIEKGSSATSYEPYVEPKIYDIYLDEPLRCLGDVCDYIDLKTKKVYRNIEVIDNSGTKKLEESLRVKEDKSGTNIDFPNITTLQGTTILSVGTNIKPSNIEVEYYK